MPHQTKISTSSSRKSHVATSAAGMMHANAVYFPNARIYGGDTPAAMNYGCISHVYYAYANVAMDGAVFLSDEWADVRAPVDGVHGGLGSLMHLKQMHPHLRVILSIGGAGSAQTFPAVAASAALRDTFARSAKGLIDASGLDGIDITWEYPYDEQQGHNFLALLAAARLYMPEESGYVITAALPPTRAVLRLIDLARASEYVDLLNLSTYDLAGPWSVKAGHHHAQLYAVSGDEDDNSSASAAVQYVMGRGFPAKKILLGVPVYGRSVGGAAGPGHKSRGPAGCGGADGGVIDYSQLPRKGAKESVDKRAGAAQCVGGDAGFVSYDTPETVKMKASFCRQKGLGGLFYWSGPMDSKEPSRSLIAAGFRALHSS